MLNKEDENDICEIIIFFFEDSAVLKYSPLQRYENRINEKYVNKEVNIWDDVLMYKFINKRINITRRDTKIKCLAQNVTSIDKNLIKQD